MNYRQAVLIVAAIPLLVIPMVGQERDDDERNDGPARHFRASLRARNELPLVTFRRAWKARTDRQ